MLLKRGKKGDAVRALQAMLKFLGYQEVSGQVSTPTIRTLDEDGIFGPATEAAVLSFQEDQGLLVDGIVGAETMAALQEAYARRHGELVAVGDLAVIETVPDSRRSLTMFTLQREPAHVYGEGYGIVNLRSDVADAYRKVYDIVDAHGAMMTSSGGIRSLHATVSAARSHTSMHYLGRAFDLYIYSGMIGAQDAPYAVTKTEEDRRYRVYARCDTGRATQTDLHQATTLTKVVTYQNREGNQECTGVFLDLTALLHDHGFKSIRARPRFEDGGSLLGAEWWHFQYEEGLIPGVSTFGQELMRLYAVSTLEGTPPWRHRDKVFGEDWW